MVMRGLVLITVCLANVLTAQAECCKCDCQQSGLQQSHLYYLPLSSPHLSASNHDTYQSLGNSQLSSINSHTQALYNSGYQSYGIGQYSGIHDVGNLLDLGKKEGSSLLSLSLPKKIEQPSFHYRVQETSQTSSGISGNEFQTQALHKPSSYYGGLGLLDSGVSSGGDLGQKQISKVSTHEGNHYIKIEKHVSPHEGSSGKDEDKGLEHDKDHHHGKNDYYKFEYGVNDHHTHDIKSHKEEKKGDVVRGEYSLVEDNGNVRTVKYYADWKNGFHAQVHNSKKTI